MRTLLPRTYYPFFARFPKLTAIQERALQPLLDGTSVLLVSATASGKTEAFVAPLIERYFSDLRLHKKHLLLVCPTRALVNDAARRLQLPLQTCGLDLRRRTSDLSENPEKQTAALWITTPEGFDSLLCRHARWLSNTVAVILDEIHLLYGSPRGTQVACLLERLDWVCKSQKNSLPQRIGSTATASQPQDIATTFLGSQAIVIEERSQRTLRTHYHKWLNFDLLRDTLSDLTKSSKVLLFTSSRAEAEEAISQLRGLPPFGNHVYVHHSSLSRRLRLQAEQNFLRQNCALLCCTTTLEVGVDIGNIDWVVLLHPPEDTLSFTQRVGRSGRRGSAAQVVACYRQSGEQLRYQYYSERKSSTNIALESRPHYQSVVIQQALSLLLQNPRKTIQAQVILNRLPKALIEDWSEDELTHTLEQLTRAKWLISGESANTFTPSPRLEAAYQRGQIHANIGSIVQKTLEIREALTRRVLGHLETDGRGRVPRQITLGGHQQALRQDFQQKSLLAQSSPHLHSDLKIPSSSPAATISLESSQDFAHWLGLGPRCLLSNSQGNLLGHFLGTCWSQILARHLSLNHPQQIFYADANVIAWQGKFEEKLWTKEALWKSLQKFAPSVSRYLQLGKWFSLLHKNRQHQQLYRHLYWEWVEKTWINSPIISVSQTGKERLLKLLQQKSEIDIAGLIPIQAEDL